MSELVASQIHVMVVEDDPNVAEVVKLLLDCNGYRATVVGTGAAALTTAAETDFDLVVLDISLPDIDGWTVFRRLRGKRAVPIICLTSMSLPTDLARARDLGIKHYLIKPRGIGQLTDTVKAVLAA